MSMTVSKPKLGETIYNRNSQKGPTYEVHKKVIPIERKRLGSSSVHL